MAQIIDARRVGNTTRIVDDLVQDFFTKGECYCYDHFHSSPEIRTHLKKRVMQLVINRLIREHSLESEKHFFVDTKNFKVTKK